jgi:hypothetical protein
MAMNRAQNTLRSNGLLQMATIGGLVGRRVDRGAGTESLEMRTTDGNGKSVVLETGAADGDGKLVVVMDSGSIGRRQKGRSARVSMSSTRGDSRDKTLIAMVRISCKSRMILVPTSAVDSNGVSIAAWQNCERFVGGLVEQSPVNDRLVEQLSRKIGCGAASEWGWQGAAKILEQAVRIKMGASCISTRVGLGASSNSGAMEKRAGFWAAK